MSDNIEKTGCYNFTNKWGCQGKNGLCYYANVFVTPANGEGEEIKVLEATCQITGRPLKEGFHFDPKRLPHIE